MVTSSVVNSMAIHFDTMQKAEFHIDGIAKEDRLTYLWQLYLQTEADLCTALKNMEQLREQHAMELLEVEKYVAQIRTLSSEREILTMEVEAENEQLHASLLQLQEEIKHGKATIFALNACNARVESTLRQYGDVDSNQSKDIANKVAQLVREHMSACTEAKEAKQELEALREGYSSDVSELLNENEEVRLENCTLRTALKNASTASSNQVLELPQLREECCKLNMQLSCLTSELADTRASYYSLQTQTARQSKDHDSTIATLKAEIGKMTSTCCQLKNTLDATDQESATTKRRLQETRDDLQKALLQLSKYAERDARHTSVLEETIDVVNASLCVAHQSGVHSKEEKHSALTAMDTDGRVALLERAAEELEADNKNLAIKLQEALDKCKLAENMLQREKSLSSELLTSTEGRMTQAAASNDSLAELKAQLAQSRLQHRLESDAFAHQLNEHEAQRRLQNDCLAAAELDLKRAQAEEARLQVSLLTEARLRQQAEERTSHIEQEMDKLWIRLRNQTDQNSKLELQKRALEEEVDQCKMSSRNEPVVFLGGALMTDNGKFLELAKSKMDSAEKRITDLQLSLEKVACSLALAEDQVKELPLLHKELQQRKDEVIRLRGQLHEEQLSRSLSAKSTEDSSRQLAASKAREARAQQQVQELQHAVLDAEAKMAAMSDRQNALCEQLGSSEKQQHLLSKQIQLTREEVETLQVELLAANEQLNLQQNKYSERKAYYKAKLAYARELFRKTKQSLREKIAYLESELKVSVLASQQETQCQEALEVRYKASMKENLELQSRNMEQDEELQEKSRCLSVCQARADYLAHENDLLADKLHTFVTDQAGLTRQCSYQKSWAMVQPLSLQLSDGKV